MIDISEQSITLITPHREWGSCIWPIANPRPQSFRNRIAPGKQPNHFELFSSPEVPEVRSKQAGDKRFGEAST